MNTEDARARRSRVAAVTCILAGLWLPAGTARGNEFGGQGAYRLGDATERMARASVLDLRERRAGGGYEFNQTTNIDRQVNCNFSVNATGNAAQPTHAAAGIAPVGIQDSGVTPSTTGNHSDSSNSSQGQGGDIHGQFPGASLTGTLHGGSLQGDPLNGGASGNGMSDLRQSANGGNLNQVHQGNTGSSLSASVSQSPLNAQIGAIDARGGEFLNSMETVQSNDGSEILATVTDSGACEFGSSAL